MNVCVFVCLSLCFYFILSASLSGFCTLNASLKKSKRNKKDLKIKCSEPEQLFLMRLWKDKMKIASIFHFEMERLSSFSC